MTNSSWPSRVIVAVTAGLGTAMTSGALNPKIAAYALIVLAFLQSLQHPVTNSTSDNKVAEEAVKANVTTK